IVLYIKKKSFVWLHLQLETIVNFSGTQAANYRYLQTRIPDGEMSTGWLYLKPPLGDQKQGSEDYSKANTDQQNSNSSQSPSVSTKTLQPKKKDKGGRGNDFNIVGNNITGIKSERVGI
ncbi:unnamed protein product, partial [Prunus brigantina]